MKSLTAPSNALHCSKLEVMTFFSSNLTNQSLIDQHFKNAQQKQAHVTFWVWTICVSFSCLFHTALVADVFTLPFQI